MTVDDTPPELSRRDALKTGGIGLVGGVAVVTIAAAGDGQALRDRGSSDIDLTEADISILVAVAEVVYPSEVTVDSDFVRRYVRRLGPQRSEQMRETVAGLQAQSRSTYGRRFDQLPPVKRAALLRALGVDRVYPRPEGTLSTRIRYHVVNGLLYALFTDPKGARLFGIENPLGHPGGYYRGDGNER